MVFWEKNHAPWPDLEITWGAQVHTLWLKLSNAPTVIWDNCMQLCEFATWWLYNVSLYSHHICLHAVWSMAPKWPWPSIVVAAIVPIILVMRASPPLPACTMISPSPPDCKDISPIVMCLLCFWDLTSSGSYGSSRWDHMDYPRQRLHPPLHHVYALLWYPTMRSWWCT